MQPKSRNQFLIAEDGAVHETENDRRNAHAHEELAGIGKRGELLVESQKSAQQNEDQPLADVAEHHAEQNQKSDGDEKRRVDTVVLRVSVSRDQRLEGLQEGGMVEFRRDRGRAASDDAHSFAFRVFRAGDVIDEPAFQQSGEFLRDPFRDFFRHPAADVSSAGSLAEKLHGLQDSQMSAKHYFPARIKLPGFGAQGELLFLKKRFLFPDHPELQLDLVHSLDGLDGIFLRDLDFVHEDALQNAADCVGVLFDHQNYDAGIFRS